MSATPLELGFAGRPRFSWDRAALCLFVIATLLVLATFDDYGVTWDEDIHNWYGVSALDYYLSRFRDLSALTWLDLVNYGAAFDMTAALVNKLSPFGTYETRHLFNGLVGVFGLIGAWKLGRLLGGARAGFLAALFLVLTPNYYGQMFNNPKDIPFGVGMIWSIYCLARLLPELPRPAFSSVLKLGIAAGLALGVRVGGFLIFGYVGLLLLIAAAWRAFDARRWSVFIAQTWVSGWRVVVPALIIAYPVMLFFWPWAQQAPVEHPLMALATFSHQLFPWKTLFAGQYIPASDLPWEYLPVHILLALPELVLLLLLASPVLAWRALRGGAVDRARVLGGFLLGLAILFPVGYAIAIKAVLFDGMRHFIFVLPPIACVAALVAERALDWLRRVSVKRTAYALLAVYGVFHVGIMASLHPDEYVYYNGFIGGVHGAQGVFKLDYWANSYAEAVQGLEDYLRAEYGPDFKDHDFTVGVCGPPASAAYYFPSNFIYTPNPAGADFFIAFTKDNCNKSLPGKEIYRVTRMDTLLSVVLDRRAVQPGRVAGGN